MTRLSDSLSALENSQAWAYQQLAITWETFSGQNGENAAIWAWTPVAIGVGAGLAIPKLVPGGPKGLYRLVEAPEGSAMTANSGRWVASPHQEFGKPFWTSLEDALEYQKISPYQGTIYGTRGKPKVGHASVDNDNMPVWIAPNDSVPLIPKPRR